MSTRANIIIKDGSGRQLIFYRHSDGYPEGALPTLKKFMSWVKDEKIRDNVDQAAGWLILIGAEEYGEIYEGGGKYKPKKTLTEPDPNNEFSGWNCGAYEPTTCIHGDIEYLYTLDLDEKTILVQGVINVQNCSYKPIETITDFSETPEITTTITNPVPNPDELEIL
jgi:hypothetical protein